MCMLSHLITCILICVSVFQASKEDELRKRNLEANLIDQWHLSSSILYKVMIINTDDVHYQNMHRSNLDTP